MLLLLFTSLAFGQSLRSVRPRSEPAGPGQASSNPGRAVGKANPRLARTGRIGERPAPPPLRWPDGRESPGGCARDPVNPPPAQPGPPQIGPPPTRFVHLQSHQVKVTVADGIATTEIEQVFRNEAGTDMEASWFCPLPPQTVLHGFSIWMGGREVHASVMDRTAARRIYDRIVGRKRDPGLVELVAGNMIRTSIFPIPAKGEFRIRTRYSSVLTGESIALPMPRTPSNSQPIARVKMDLVCRSSRPIRLGTPKETAVRLTHRDDGCWWSGRFRATKHRGKGPVLVPWAVRRSEPGLTLNVHPGRYDERTFAAVVTAGNRKLTKAKLSFEGLRIDSMHPAEIPELPPGGSVVIFGRLTGQGKPVARLFARQGLMPVRVTASAGKTSTTAAETRHIPCFWALGEFHELAKNEKTRGAALQLAIRHGILTEYTALLAK